MQKLENFKTKLQKLDSDKRKFVLEKLQAYSDAISKNSTDSVVGGIKKAKSYIAAAYLTINEPKLDIEQINHADVRGLGCYIFSGGTVVIMSQKSERVLGEVKAQAASYLFDVANEYEALGSKSQESFKNEVMSGNTVKISSHKSKVGVFSILQNTRG